LSEYAGILTIGDPHLASRTLDFRRDDYGRTSLRKLVWCLEYSRDHALLPVFLGDLFHYARDNANWLLGEILAAFSTREVVGIYGNHDCRENTLGPDDSLSVLVSAGHYRLLSTEAPWRGRVGGVDVTLIGVSWGCPLPNAGPEDGSRTLLVTHHDVRFAGYEEGGRFDAREIPGIELVVNGHIHRRLDERQVGGTLWINPGNICRVSRSDATRATTPGALRLVPIADGWARECVEVPHDDYDDVFHDGVVDEAPEGSSEFVRGLAELQARRTDTGAGLRHFLDQNLYEFDPKIREEIEELAAAVLSEP
jgi:hypothetical protein